MSGLQRAMRHPDRRNEARARALLSDQLLAPLPTEDAAWLRAHLDTCPACRRMADSFAADHARILALRDELPAPPRDLGARLSRALDVEVRRAIREEARRDRRSPTWAPPLAVAGLAVAAALVVVFLPLALAGLGPGGAGIVPGSNGMGGLAATPMTVRARAVAWVQRQPDGSYVLNSASVDRVCPGLDASACGTLDRTARQVLALAVKPSAIVLQHNGTSAVLMSGNVLYAFTVPRDARVTPAPFPSSFLATPGALSPTPAVTGVGATPPAATPVPAGSAGPSPTRTPQTSAVPAASAFSGPTSSLSSASPIPTAAPSATPIASVVPTPGASLVSIPPASAGPAEAVTTPIIEDVVLVGAPPAYSADEQWVAFSARPQDDSQGPDIYVWRVGDPKARALTTDHASVFSAWNVDQILGSTLLPAGSTLPDAPAVTIAPVVSPVPASPSGGLAAPSATPARSPSSSPSPSPSPSAAAGRPSSGITPSPAAASAPPSAAVVSFLLDPVTGVQTLIARAAVWRPVVDPTNRVVVFWTGDQALDPATNTWVPTSGRLVTADWVALMGPGEVTAIPLPGSAGLEGVTGWDVRWDPSGRHLAVWIADPSDRSVGLLSFFAVNADGSIGETLLSDVAALPGLSLGSDLLAWASPPGQNGQGSTISIYAWSDAGAGSLYSAPDPGSDGIVIAR